ncbi:hypothetical protein GCM10009548_88700 [Streptomyces malaysiensis subsp. malaysiensis]
MPPAAKAPEKLAIEVVLIQLDMLERPQTSCHVGRRTSLGDAAQLWRALERPRRVSLRAQGGR